MGLEAVAAALTAVAGVASRVAAIGSGTPATATAGIVVGVTAGMYGMQVWVYIAVVRPAGIGTVIPNTKFD